MIFCTVSVIMIFLYYAIKDAIGNCKLFFGNKCPFCGAYLHGYQYRRKGAKFNAKYCSRCGRSLNNTEHQGDTVNHEIQS